ncbi:hypothetical protein ACFXG4_49885 [Nocardia sp. NPDC059246]|uniref:hypothetical protein n=1 Tax=unclassified Nocardia TaxID=2637762 RepID=UPI00368305C6
MSLYAGANHAVLIAVADPDQSGEQAALTHLDVLVGQVRTAHVAVDAEVFVVRLVPGEWWTDLIDPDNPGGQVAGTPRWQHPGTCRPTPHFDVTAEPVTGKARTA